MLAIKSAKKLVIFKIGSGTFEQGFPVTLQIYQESDRSLVFLEASFDGKLPSFPEIPFIYQSWQSEYRQFLRQRNTTLPNLKDKRTVIEQKRNPGEFIDAVNQKAKILLAQLNLWLNSQGLRKIRENFLHKVRSEEIVRLVIQTEDPLLKRLPWHLWDFFEKYPKIEVALSTPDFQSINKLNKNKIQDKCTVKILGIIGDCFHPETGLPIDIATDKLFIESLPDIESPVFLVEPKRQEINDWLRDQGWDILFFAGHSNSDVDGITGSIRINRHESLTIPQLKYALKKAVDQGLKLAIFNSCDGLGIARYLAELYIPQIIVMREPIPDLVAKEFLKYFLKGFSGGKPFYLAVREAREGLHGLEDNFPCASWLPVICQNPAEFPPTWKTLFSIKPEIFLINKPIFEGNLHKNFSVDENPVKKLQEIKEEVASRKHIKFTMLGTTGAGKTCYLIGMYAFMQTGISGFSLSSKELDIDLEIDELCKRLNTFKGEEWWPLPNSAEVKNYGFNFNHSYRPIISFDWLDYRGGAISDRSTEPDVQKLVEHISDSSCLFLCISGEDLCKKVDYSTVIRIQSNRINHFIVKIGSKYKPNCNQPFPVVIVITKSDLCIQHSQQQLIEDIQQLFPILFAPKSPWLVMICFVSLITPDMNNLPTQLLNLHKPLFFAVYFNLKTLVSQIKSQINDIRRELNPVLLKFNFFKDSIKKIQYQKKYNKLRELEEEIAELKQNMTLLAQELQGMPIFFGDKILTIDEYDELSSL
ncbi:CHAT domain-containing protein [Aerosakkonemataceae cyanobacterium BLCC-F50]|uniref:CHAT domain-containing protein n=1 Tax=Floridaenema flaviceps BLCC-F50 TaxID=3153642 RepID=A0ABV4XKG3_9CYAN